MATVKTNIKNSTGEYEKFPEMLTKTNRAGMIIIEEVTAKGDALEVVVDLGPLNCGDALLFDIDPLDWSEFFTAHKQDALNDVHRMLGDIPKEGQDISVGDVKTSTGGFKCLLYKTTVELDSKNTSLSSRLPKSKYEESALIKRLQALYDGGFWNESKDFVHVPGDGVPYLFCGSANL